MILYSCVMVLRVKGRHSSLESKSQIQVSSTFGSISISESEKWGMSFRFGISAKMRFMCAMIFHQKVHFLWNFKQKVKNMEFQTKSENWSSPLYLTGERERGMSMHALSEIEWPAWLGVGTCVGLRLSPKKEIHWKSVRRRSV